MLIAEERFNSRDVVTRNVMLSLGSIFGTLNLSNTLDLLDNSLPSGQRWSKKGYMEGQTWTAPETLVTEYVAAVSGRTVFQASFRPFVAFRGPL